MPKNTKSEKQVVSELGSLRGALESARKSQRTLVAPFFTEKVNLVAGSPEKGQTLVFRVDFRSSKPEIRQAVENALGVKVAEVRTASYKGKPKRVGAKQGYRTRFKKAYISLKPGEKVSIVEGV
ncbi:MAG TPA: 50S ribosomal protein L23 [Oligoflexia bacterium]|nr:50S ribosomal protein L23 [Oligoflexia bacterium]HMP26496.1 50S ribosomal protein L23 [Oligoflexia bacterium]